MLAEQDPSILGTRRLVGIAAATRASILFLVVALVVVAVAITVAVVPFAIVGLGFGLVAAIRTVLGVAIDDRHVWASSVRNWNMRTTRDYVAGVVHLDPCVVEYDERVGQRRVIRGDWGDWGDVGQELGNRGTIRGVLDRGLVSRVHVALGSGGHACLRVPDENILVLGFNGVQSEYDRPLGR